LELGHIDQVGSIFIISIIGLETGICHILFIELLKITFLTSVALQQRRIQPRLQTTKSPIKVRMLINNHELIHV